jgi:site-specific recombinase XerD
MRYRSFGSAFERAVRKAEIVDFTIHNLRYAFASHLVGVGLPTVKELLGNRDISMTVQYAHLSSDHKEMAMRKLERLAAKVPAMLTTPPADHLRARIQILKH